MNTISDIEEALYQASALASSMRKLSSGSSNREDEELYLHWTYEIEDLEAELQQALSERTEW